MSKPPEEHSLLQNTFVFFPTEIIEDMNEMFPCVSKKSHPNEIPCSVSKSMFNKTSPVFNLFSNKLISQGIFLAESKTPIAVPILKCDVKQKEKTDIFQLYQSYGTHLKD